MTEKPVGMLYDSNVLYLTSNILNKRKYFPITTNQNQTLLKEIIVAFIALSRNPRSFFIKTLHDFEIVQID